MIDEGPNVGSMHIHTEEGMSFPSDEDIIGYRCMKEQDHYIVSPNEIWYVHAEESFGPMGRLTQMDITKVYGECIKEGNAAVEKQMRDGKIGLDENQSKEPLIKRLETGSLKSLANQNGKTKA